MQVDNLVNLGKEKTETVQNDPILIYEWAWPETICLFIYLFIIIIIIIIDYYFGGWGWGGIDITNSDLQVRDNLVPW